MMTEAPRLLLTSSSGQPVEARLVRRGDRFGPGGNLRYGGYQPCLEFQAPRPRWPKYLGSYASNLFPMIARNGFAPGEDPAAMLSPSEIRRLLAWLEDPEAGQDSALTALLVGDGVEMGRVASALSRISLRSAKAEEGPRGLSVLVAQPPSVAIVGEQVLRMSALAFLSGVRRNERTRDVPMLLLGGDRDRALHAGANAHLPWPCEPKALVACVGGLLELV